MTDKTMTVRILPYDKVHIDFEDVEGYQITDDFLLMSMTNGGQVWYKLSGVEFFQVFVND